MIKSILLLGLLAAPFALHAEELALVFEPAKTQLHWTLDTALHTVHGSFQLRSGTVQYDPATGRATGALVVDARSGQSGSGPRDSRMHGSILESTKYADIVFRPDRVEGTVPVQGDGTIQVYGQFELHGQSREIVLPVQLHVEAGRTTAATHFEVPYLHWGLKYPGNFILKVSDKVAIELTAEARVTGAGGK
jgi:polyisoprenoid-binding protein YceI